MKLPQAWLTAGTKPVKTKVEARIDMSEEVAGKGLCPDCRGQMEPAVANEHQVLQCMECRIAIPVADEKTEPEVSPGNSQEV